MEDQQSVASLEELFITGCEHHQSGRLKQAIEIYLELLKELPDSPLLLYNTGLALYELGDLTKAIHYYKQAASAAPGDTDTLFNLALCYQKTNNEEKALFYYKKTIEGSQQDSPDIHYNMGCCYQQKKKEDAAISCYEKVIQLDEEHTSALNNLAYLYHKNGHHDQAIKTYEHLLQLQPDNSSAQHMLASLTGNVSSNSPQKYVEEVFNNYSSHYEESLVKELQYNVPDMLRTLYNNIGSSCHRVSAALDLGCGTGLSGLAFHDICDNLTGIDLSANMLVEADKKQIYDQLVVSDIIDFLNKSSTPLYDLIIAADVMTYIGDLERIFTCSYKRSSPNCIYCFSTETSQEKDIELGKTGRFKHSTDYIRRTALSTGWQLMLQSKADLRLEKGKWVHGHLSFLSKQVR